MCTLAAQEYSSEPLCNIVLNRIGCHGLRALLINHVKMDAARKGKRSDVRSPLAKGISLNQQDKKREGASTRDGQPFQVSEKKTAVTSESRRGTDTVKTGAAKIYNTSEEARAHAYKEWLERKQHSEQVNPKQSDGAEKHEKKVTCVLICVCVFCVCVCLCVFLCVICVFMCVYV